MLLNHIQTLINIAESKYIDPNKETFGEGWSDGHAINRWGNWGNSTKNIKLVEY